MIAKTMCRRRWDPLLHLDSLVNDLVEVGYACADVEAYAMKGERDTMLPHIEC
jgi:hypothetical protein